MTGPFLLLLASFALCVLFIPLLSRLAVRIGLVDHPDGRRKLHARATPLVGGIAIFLSITTVLIVAVCNGYLSTGVDGADGGRWLFGLLCASALICGVGVVDDCIGLRGRFKLLGQFAAIGIILVINPSDVRSITLLGESYDIGAFWSYAFTFCWLLGAINSLNLLDGMDGLLGTVGVIVAVTIAAMSYTLGHYLVTAAAGVLAGAICGFLFFNLPPARVFLGDCGSMLIGLVLGVLAIRSSLKGATSVMLAVPLALLILPILDTGAAIARRTLTGRNIFTTDRGHLHHCLQRYGMSPRVTLLLVAGLSLLAGLGAMLSLALQNEVFAIAAAMVVAGILIISRLFGFAEVVLIKKRIGSLLVGLRSRYREGRAREMTVRLQGSTDWDAVWHALIEIADRMELTKVCLNVNAPQVHENYHAKWDRPRAAANSEPLWQTSLPLTANGQAIGKLELAGRSHGRNSMFESLSALEEVAKRIEQIVETLTATTTRHGLSAPTLTLTPAVSLPAPAPSMQGHSEPEPVHAG